MSEEKYREQLRERIYQLCENAIAKMDQMLIAEGIPASTKTQIIGIILERAMGKPETQVKVKADAESVREAEKRLAAMIEELRTHGELRENWEKEAEMMGDIVTIMEAEIQDDTQEEDNGTR